MHQGGKCAAVFAVACSDGSGSWTSLRHQVIRRLWSVPKSSFLILILAELHHFSDLNFVTVSDSSQGSVDRWVRHTDRICSGPGLRFESSPF